MGIEMEMEEGEKKSIMSFVKVEKVKDFLIWISAAWTTSCACVCVCEL
jgi:hypothetical protein